MIKIQNKYIKIILICILSFIFSLTLLTISSTSAQSVEDIRFTGKVNTTTLNVRQGPGTNFDICTTLKKEDIVNVIGKVGEWYLIQTSDNIFGLCNNKYIDDTGEYSAENTVLNAINVQRDNNKIKKLIMDNKLTEIAKVKAQDIIDNNYFSHNSEKLGTPLEMLNKYDVKYMTVGENIAKSNDIQELVTLVTTSESYKQNSLSNDYNYTGIAILPIDEYEYIYVQLFVGRQ